MEEYMASHGTTITRIEEYTDGYESYIWHVFYLDGTHETFWKMCDTLPSRVLLAMQEASSISENHIVERDVYGNIEEEYTIKTYSI
jgi:hypothetical protein